MSKFLKVCRPMNVTTVGIFHYVDLVNESKQEKPFHFFFKLMSAPKLVQLESIRVKNATNI